MRSERRIALRAIETRNGEIHVGERGFPDGIDAKARVGGGRPGSEAFALRAESGSLRGDIETPQMNMNASGRIRVLRSHEAHRDPRVALHFECRDFNAGATEMVLDFDGPDAVVGTAGNRKPHADVGQIFIDDRDDYRIAIDCELTLRGIDLRAAHEHDVLV